MLPQIPRRVQKRNNIQIQMLGLNFTDNYRLGELSDSKHISSEHYPYISTPDLPVNVALEYENKDIVWVYCYGDKVLYCERSKNSGSCEMYYRDISEKQFKDAEPEYIGWFNHIPTSTALLDNRLVLWPSAVVINLNSMKTQWISNDWILDGVTVTPGKLVYTSINDTAGSALMEDDWVELECTTDSSINGGYSVKSIDWENKTIYLPDETLDTLAGTHHIILKRSCPDMTCICEYGNRVWGSDGKTIYSSKQGNPFNFMDYSALADSAYFVDTIGGDEILACQKLGSACCFFGRKAMHKVIGNYPAEYQLYTYSIDGILDVDSLKNVNEVIYFQSITGINAYSGGRPQVFFPLGPDAKEITDFHAGTDGINYYFSTRKEFPDEFLDHLQEIKEKWEDSYQGDPKKNEKVKAKMDAAIAMELKAHPEKYHSFYEMDLQHGLCILLDHVFMKSMAVSDNYLFYVAETHEGSKLYEIPRKAYIPETKDDYRDYVYDGDWHLEMKPIYEAVTGSYNRSAIANTFKRYHKLTFRINLGEKSSLKIEVSEDGNPWRTVHLEAGGKKGIRPIVVPIGRCDQFRIRLSGSGACQILNMEREFSLGAER